MTTKPRMIAEDVLLPTHFLSASEQDGVYLGQPEPDDNNSGSLRPISVGSNFTSMVLDATLASGPQDTHFNAAGFNIYGDDYFINCKMKALKQFVDSGDTKHNVVGHGALSVSDAKRFSNHGIYFDGSASFISITDHANWDVQTNFSVDLWVKHESFVGEMAYVGHYEDINNRWLFHHTNGYGLLWYMASGGVQIVGTVGGGEITDTNWHHVLMAKVGNEYGVYKDGTQVGYVNDASMSTFTGPLYIGQRGGSNSYFDGHMDEVCIYHGNLFNASPNSGLTDTITVPTTPHESDSDTKLFLHGDVAERTISDFRQVDGKITVSSAFDANLATDEAFQITLDKDDVDFRLELTDGGDVGTAKFKWSHDGGSNYLGRNEVLASNWLAEATLATMADYVVNFGRAVEAENGDIIATYSGPGGPGPVYAIISSDKGKTWSERIKVFHNSYNRDLIKLKNGRLLALVVDGWWIATDELLFYSDDNGQTWNELARFGSFGSSSCLIELQNGNIIVAYSSGEVKCKISTDGGASFGSEIPIAADANSQIYPALIQAENGNIVCVYQSNEDAGGAAYEIKGAYSSDGGLTWTSTVDVISTATLKRPDVIKDIDGTLYASGTHATLGAVEWVRSTDYGVTWNHTTGIYILRDLTNGPRNATLCRLSCGDIICLYHGDITNKLFQVRRGMWEKSQTLATNACPCAIESLEQNLICNVKVKWTGYAGIEEDKWDFSPEYYFAKENLLLDSPSQPWRSKQDNIEVSIVIDLETSKGYPFDSIGLFGCNVRTLKIQASPVNETKVWVLPPIDEEISFDVDTTGVIDSVVNNYIEDVALLANYKDHELRNHYIQMTNGPDNGQTYKIIDNIGGRFEVLSAETIRAIVGNTFTIFKTDISAFFINPDTTSWTNLGSLEISGSNNQVEDQDIVGNLYLSGSAATNNLTRLLVGGDATLSTNSHDNCITGLQCTGTITDHGTNNVIEEGGWFNYPYRYIRILIESQDTYEGYYQVGNPILGKYTELSRNWRVGYNLDSDFGIKSIRTPHGGLSTIRKHNEIKRFNLTWHQVDNTNTELTKLIDYIGGRNICLIPDSDSPDNCYLTKFTGDIKRRHTLLNRFDISLVMEEVI